MSDLIRPYGVGRIRRESCRLHIGEHAFDLDGLRRYTRPASFDEAARSLNPPPSAEECIWLVDFVRLYYSIDSLPGFLAFLYELVGPQPICVDPNALP